MILHFETQNITHVQGAWVGSPVVTGQESARETSGVQTWASPATGLTSDEGYVIAFIWDNGTETSNLVISDVFRTLADIATAFFLSLPGVTNIKATSATPVVEITYQ